MGVARAGNLETVGQSNAQFSGGSLRFDSTKSHYLSRTPASASNRKTWTWAGWVKLCAVPGTYTVLFGAGAGGSDSGLIRLNYESSGKLNLAAWNTDPIIRTAAVYRDFSAWYHIVVAVDTANATASNRAKIYINGTEAAYDSDFRSSISNLDTPWNSNVFHAIGRLTSSDGQYANAYFANVYNIDGQALDASYFGYTDPLTNTWRPKKYTGTFGTNGFYLPLDGNTPIGQDRSGRGNNWTPVNFGGSNTIEKATGALPILNTDGGGKVARVGVRTDSNASSLVLALPLVGIKSDFSNRINSGTTEKAITANGNAAASSTQSNFYGGSWYFDGTGDYLTVSPSPDASVGTGDFCYEGWFYMPTASGTYLLFDSVQGTGVYLYTTSSSLYFYIGSGQVGSSACLVSNKWHHIAFTRESGTCRIFCDGILVGSGSNSGNVNGSTLTIGRRGSDGNYEYSGYIQDVRVYKGTAKYTQNFIPASTDPDILPDTPSGVAYSSTLSLPPSTDGAVAFDGSGDYLSLPNDDTNFRLTGDFTIELFVYAPTISASSGYAYIIDYAANGSDGWGIVFYNNQLFALFDYGANGPNAWGPSSSTQLNANQWYHIAWTRQSNVHYYYINGKKYTGATQSFSAPSSSSSNVLNIGRFMNNSSYFTGLVSNVHVVNGTAIYTADFTPPTAPITSVANTKLLCCKSNSSTIAADVSPTTITANGGAIASIFNPFTVNINTQRGQESGYCTLNPLKNNSNNTLSDGNLKVVNSASSTSFSFGNIVLPRSGKYYFEALASANGVDTNVQIGIFSTDHALTASGSKRYWYLESGGLYDDGSLLQSVSTYGNGDLISVAYNADASTITWYKNGVQQGTAVSVSTSYDYVFGVGIYKGQWNVNFGQKPFKFPPPAGFQPLALANTPRPTIVRPDRYVGISTWTGDDVNNRKITTNFKPDLFWAKSRSSTPYHTVNDSVRGVNAILQTNTTSPEQVNSNGYVTAFLSDGVTVTNGSDINSSSYGNYVGWAWKAGGSGGGLSFWKDDIGYSTASAAGLTAGTITPTGASVGTKNGFSIIRYTGTGANATVSHGLGNAPAFMMFKQRTATGGTSGVTNWRYYHTSLGNTKAFYVPANTVNTSSSYWNNTSPTSTVFTIGTDDGVNDPGSGFICYAWAEIPGFSKFGSYTGNGSTDGPAVITGFRPRFIMIKSTGSDDRWTIQDTSRDSYNPSINTLSPNLPNAELTTGFDLDITSNGFKIRNTNSGHNTSSGTYIYAAFAEAPSFNLYGGQSNAR